MLKIVCFALLTEAVLAVSFVSLAAARHERLPEVSLEERTQRALEKGWCGLLYECA